MMKRLGLVLALTVISGCKGQEVRPTAPAPISGQIFVSADLRGFLAPCGCSEQMRGGIARAAAQVSRARSAGGPVLYLDAGDSLFSLPRLGTAEVPQAERKARAIAEAFKKMGLATWAVGELDRTLGEDFLRSLGLPAQEPGTFRLLELGGHRIGIAAAGEGPALVVASKAARAAGAKLVIGILHQPMEAAQKAAELPGLSADLVISSHSGGGLSGDAEQRVRGTVPVVKVEGKGRSMLRLDVAFAGSAGERFELLKGEGEASREVAAVGERIELLRRQLDSPGLRPEAKQLRREKLEELVLRREALIALPPPAPGGKNSLLARFIPLEPGLSEDPGVKAVVAAYDREVGEINLEWARAHGQDCPPIPPGEAGFVGSEACRGCHAGAFPVWEASKHARAYATLERDGRHFDLDCVRCHVTGAGRPGGVCRIDKVEGRKAVGCESCHGPGSLHLSIPSQANVTLAREEKACTGCHDPENSRHFELGAFTRQLLGPGHGEPPVQAAP